MSMSMNVSSKMYDITKAKIMCSALKGSCQLKLLFPNTQYVVVTTPSNVISYPLGCFVNSMEPLKF